MPFEELNYRLNLNDCCSATLNTTTQCYECYAVPLLL